MTIVQDQVFAWWMWNYRPEQAEECGCLNVCKRISGGQHNQINERLNKDFVGIAQDASWNGLCTVGALPEVLKGAQVCRLKNIWLG